MWGHWFYTGRIFNENVIEMKIELVAQPERILRVEDIKVRSATSLSVVNQGKEGSGWTSISAYHTEWQTWKCEQILKLAESLLATAPRQSCSISIFPYQFNINYSVSLLINTNINNNYFKEALSISISYQLFETSLINFNININTLILTLLSIYISII